MVLITLCSGVLKFALPVLRHTVKLAGVLSVLAVKLSCELLDLRVLLFQLKRER